MVPQDDLFRLIHSLTPSEKRYFKVFASKHTIGTRNNYEKLFAAFDALPTDEPYDEKAFKESLKRKNFGQNLASEKNYLHQLILQAMRSFHAANSKEVMLNNMLNDIQYYYAKGLIQTGLRAIDKALELAAEIENLPMQLSLFFYKTRLSNHTDVKDAPKSAEKDATLEREILLKLEAERKAIHLRIKTYNLYNANKLKPDIPALKKQISELQAVIANLSEPTFYTKISLLVSQALIAETERRYADGMKHYEEMIALWDKNRARLNEPTAYIRHILNNYLVCAFYCEDFSVFPQTITRIESLPIDNIREEAETFRIAKDMQLLYLLNLHDKSGAQNLILDIDKGLTKYTKLIATGTAVKFRMNICLLLLQMKNYDTLLDEINKTYSLIGRNEKYYDYLPGLKFCELMAHSSLKNYELLDYQVQNTERWVREHGLQNDCTKEIFKIFRTVIKGEKPQKLSGQLTEVNCPPETEMIKQLVLMWMNG